MVLRHQGLEMLFLGGCDRLQDDLSKVRTQSLEPLDVEVLLDVCQEVLSKTNDKLLFNQENLFRAVSP